MACGTTMTATGNSVNSSTLLVRWTLVRVHNTYSSNGLRAPLFYVTSLCRVLHGPYNRSYCGPEAPVEMNVNSPSYGL